MRVTTKVPLLTKISKRCFQTGAASTQSWGSKQDLTQALIGGSLILGVGYIAFNWYVKRSGLSWRAKECIVRANILEESGDIKGSGAKLLEAHALTEKEFGRASLSYVLMADKVAQFYHRHGDLTKAKQFYVSLIQSMLQLGYKETNKGIVGAALSVADISKEQNDVETAIAGYKWCIERTAVDVSSAKGEIDSPPPGMSIRFITGTKLESSDAMKDELHIICLERLGYCLYELKASSWPEARDYFEQARVLRLQQLDRLATAGLVSGDSMIRMAVLLESMSTVKTSLEDVEGALEDSTRAADLHKLVATYFEGQAGGEDTLTAKDKLVISNATRKLVKKLREDVSYQPAEGE